MTIPWSKFTNRTLINHRFHDRGSTTGQGRAVVRYHPKDRIYTNKTARLHTHKIPIRPPKIRHQTVLHMCKIPKANSSSARTYSQVRPALHYRHHPLSHQRKAYLTTTTMKSTINQTLYPIWRTASKRGKLSLPPFKS